MMGLATMAAKRPAVGDECWEVEWCEESFVDEHGDGDLDRDRRACRSFKTEAAAMAFAKRIFPKDAYGYVRVTPMRFVPYDDDDAIRFPHAGYWEATWDSEFYEGEG